MKTVLITYGKPAYITSNDIPLDANKESIGFDLYAEAEPGKWIPASALPEGVLEAQQKAGTLTAGIMDHGTFYAQLNVQNSYQKLIAASKGINLKGPERVGFFELVRMINSLQRQLQRNHIAELQAKIAKLDNARLKSVERTAKAKKTHVPRTEPERSSPFPWLPDLNRTFTGKPITTKQLEAVAIAETLMKKGFKEKEGSALDNETMTSLRAMLDQKTMQKRAFTG